MSPFRRSILDHPGEGRSVAGKTGRRAAGSLSPASRGPGSAALDARTRQPSGSPNTQRESSITPRRSRTGFIFRPPGCSRDKRPRSGPGNTPCIRIKTCASRSVLADLNGSGELRRHSPAGPMRQGGAAEENPFHKWARNRADRPFSPLGERRSGKRDGMDKRGRICYDCRHFYGIASMPP